MAIKFILCGLVSLAFSLLLAPMVVRACKKLKAGQNILHYVDKHMKKQGTPTMGGFIFLFPLVVGLLFLTREQRFPALFLLVVTYSYALLGFLDDFIKIHYHRNEGLKPYQKVIGQLGIAIIVGVYAYFSGGSVLNFFGLKFDIGLFVIPLVVLVLVATTNSVNLTDGLDGLAGGVSFSYVTIFGAILALLTYENLALMCFSLAGALVGFLAYNAYPAKIFMGDTGSLALGGFIGTVAVLAGLEFILPIMGIMFVLSAVSDIIQVLHYKRTKKRVFLMAPLHHHFEQKGVNENRIVVVYIIITTAVSLGVLAGYLAVV